MLVAVVSSDGKAVNQPFGKANRFLIYEVDADQITFKESRDNDPAGGTDESQGHDDDVLERAISHISDCDAVLCARIGPGAYNEVMGHGILPFEVRDNIEAAIKAYLNYKRAVERVDQRASK